MEPLNMTSNPELQSEVLALKKLFESAKQFPQVLVTQNKGAMQQAYVKVPLETWAERVMDLQEALQCSRAGTLLRRSMVTFRSSGMTPLVDELLDKAFLDKYDELMERIIYDFNDFFPYNITATNPKVMIFEKMPDAEMVEYVIKKL
jgi:hypothetical protein